MSINLNHLKHQSPRINRGIGYDTFIVRKGKKRYILRIESKAPNSRLKILRHHFFLKYLNNESFVQKVINSGYNGNQFYFTTEFIAGKNLKNLNEKSLIKIKQILRKIHRRKLLGAGKFNVQKNRGEFINWNIYINDIIKKILSLKNHKNLKSIVEETLIQSKNLGKNIKQRPANRLLHADLNRENILIAKKRLFLLDWENVTVGDPIADYAILMNFWNLKKIINEKLLSKVERDIFLFYRKIFFLLEIFYKRKYNMSISGDIKRISEGL